jgi:hypothetical protein
LVAPPLHQRDAKDRAGSPPRPGIREGRLAELAGPSTNPVAAEPRHPTSRPARRRRELANSTRGRHRCIRETGHEENGSIP